MTDSKRLEILKASLVKKQELYSKKQDAHIKDVLSANGQPLNDKRNGQATLSRWDKQCESLKKADTEIEKTQLAIENEEWKIEAVKVAKDQLPQEILDLLNSGDLTQWRKYPNMFFVAGVEKARIIWDFKKKNVSYKYLSSITEAEQRKKFAQVYNFLYNVLK